MPAIMLLGALNFTLARMLNPTQSFFSVVIINENYHNLDSEEVNKRQASMDTETVHKR